MKPTDIWVEGRLSFFYYAAWQVLSAFFFANVLIMGTGYIIGGIRLALVVGGFILFIALTEWWDRALITAYMATFGVIVSAIIGKLIV